MIKMKSVNTIHVIIIIFFLKDSFSYLPANTRHPACAHLKTVTVHLRALVAQIHHQRCHVIRLKQNIRGGKRAQCQREIAARSYFKLLNNIGRHHSGGHARAGHWRNRVDQDIALSTCKKIRKILN